LWGLIHAHGFSAAELASTLPTMALGAVYAIAYVKTGNITIPLSLHIFNNAFALIAGGS